jgi:flagellar biosynthesis GTPase FlhF
VQSSYLPLADAAPGTPPAVCALVERLLAADPAGRPVADLTAAVDEAWHRPYGVPDPPYVGLEALDRRWAGYIAGRDADREEVVARLRERRAVVLSGPSGTGKSSLATAGVAARLDEEMMLGTDGWQVAVMRPSQARDPVLAGARPPGGVGLVLVVDQLEELLGLPEEERDRFCDDLAALVFAERVVELGGLAIAPSDPVRVIATARDDLFGRLAALPALRRFPEQNLYTVRGVEPNAIRAIVAEPARASGYQVEAVDEVVDEARALLAADPSALPLVQFALTRWWEQRDEAARSLTRTEWAKIGGIEGALADSAEELYAALSPAEGEAMRQILVELFRPDGTRVRVAESELAGGAEAGRVLEALASHRLIRRQQMERGAAVEVVHEALARRWPKLRFWLEESRAERELIQEARYDAERWQRRGGGAELLWRGERLAAALRLRGRMGEAAAFIDASAAEESSGRLRRRVVLGVVAGLVGAAAILLFSYAGASSARERAEDARQRAEEAKAAAEDARTRAEQEAADNRKLRAAAEVKVDQAERDRYEARKVLEDAQAQAAASVAATEAARKAAEEERRKAMELRERAEVDLQAAQQGQKFCQQALEKRDQKFAAERNLLLDKIERCERALPNK